MLDQPSKMDSGWAVKIGLGEESDCRAADGKDKVAGARVCH